MSAAMPSRAHAPALRNGRPLPPRDDAVPQLSGLLRTDVMTAALERSLRGGCAIDDVRVTLVDYRPRSGCTVAPTRSGKGRGGMPATRWAMARMCSSVVPQQPPTRFTKPCSANSPCRTSP